MCLHCCLFDSAGSASAVSTSIDSSRHPGLCFCTVVSALTICLDNVLASFLVVVSCLLIASATAQRHCGFVGVGTCKVCFLTGSCNFPA